MFLNPWYGGKQPLLNSDISVEEGNQALQNDHTQLPSHDLDFDELKKFLNERQAALPLGWTIHLLRDGRFFYCNHASQSSSWLPPLETWDSGSNLPYGWESAVDKEGKSYFINHLTKTTTYDDPRQEVQEEPPQPRHVELTRDSDMGFGFVAGSEKPVIVRFVTDNGPSVDKLLPGDQILIINGEDVKKAPRDHVIQLVRSCKEKVTLTVCQPPLDNSARKSALLSAAKKQRLKNNPSRVRFAESVDINGSASDSPSQISSSESTTPFMPNVLKVFLENGQTKSFKYDSSTTVEDVLESLHQKLGIKCPEHFSLVVEHVKSLRRNKLTLLDPKETLASIASRPGAQLLRCLYRITFVPKDAYDLLRKDSVAFEYLYLQCCNDVIQERFSPELKYDVALRLAALHIHQHTLSASGGNSMPKLSLKSLEKECGLERFVPTSLVDSMKRKELRKLLSHFMKLHGGFTAPGQKQLTALQAKLHYLKIISELPSYGAKCFSTNAMEGNVEAVLLISPRFGISQIAGVRNSMPEPLCDIEQVTSVAVTREDELSKRVELSLKHPDKENVVLSLEDRDSDELVLVLKGYYRLLTEKNLDVIKAKDAVDIRQAPPYHSRHRVSPATWNYINGSDVEDAQNGPSQRMADFAMAPPYQQPPEEYQIPNGHVAKVNENSGDRNLSANEHTSYFDSNMNRTNSVYENSGVGSSEPSKSIINGKKSAFAGANAPSHEFKKVSYSSQKTEREPPQGSEDPLPPGVNEAHNMEVIKRVAKMHQMVEDAETYLSDVDGETTDGETARPESYGKLKHSDSLLLLTQGQKLIPNGELECDEKSGSDTDSQSTPSTSPAHKPGIKASGSSFGLHSPDNLPIDLENNDNDIKALIRQLEDNSGLPYTFAEGTLYLDPDIIDLTMIPPPITPDDDGAKMLPPQLNTPPTPFADRETLDQELKALERDVGDLRSLTNTNWREDFLKFSSNSSATASDTDDTVSLSSVSTSRDSSLVRSSYIQNMIKKNGANGPGFTLAALKQLGVHLGEGDDIDSFIANLTIPPPPEGSNNLQAYLEQRAAGADYDIAAYIIPPPPTNSTNDHRSSDIIRRLYEAKEGISRVVGDQFAEKDNDINEVRVKTEQLSRDHILPGRVASLQKRFESTNSSSKSHSDSHPHSLKLNKSKLTTAQDISLTSSLRLSNKKPAIESYIAEAIEENSKLFQNFENEAKRNSLNDTISPPTSPRSAWVFGQEHPKTKKAESEEMVPPPPPRTPVTRTDHFGVSKNSALKTSFSLQNSPIHLTNLSKSASQGDIAHHTQTNTILRSPSKNNKVSISSEDVRNCKSSLGSPLKQTSGSSNDSVNSTSSAVTVRSLSTTTSPDQEDVPPELPPRNSQKPPVGRSHSQDHSKPSVLKGNLSSSRLFSSFGSLDRPPAIPSRSKKPHISPSTSPPGTLVTTHRAKPFQKPPAPQPPQVPSLPVNNSRSPSRSPKMHGSSLSNNKPQLLMKVKSPSIPINQDVPLLTSSPKLPVKSKMLNGKTSISSELDDSLDSGSFDQDSLEEIEDIETMLPASREAFKISLGIVNDSIKRLSDMITACSRTHKAGINKSENNSKFQTAKDSLISESRQFVTASKLFVKSATESEEVLLESLSKCVSILQRMVTHSEEIVSFTSTPLQTQSVIIKVRDVSGIYMSTVRAALSASGKGMDHPSMNSLMAQATSLAGILTALMRTLRVFSP